MPHASSDMDTTANLGLDHLLDGLGAVALESIRTPAGIFASDFRILWLNRAMAFVHGCQVDEAVGQYCHKALKNCDTTCKDCCMRRVLDTGRTMVADTEIELPRGGTRWGELHAYPIRGRGTSIDAIMVIAFDTTSRVLLQRQQESTIVDHSLSPREIQVLKLIVEGYTNGQISEALALSSHTVKTHVTNVFNKLGVNDRTQAAVQAVRSHIV